LAYLGPYIRAMQKAVVLLSGGVDSATVLALARERGFACHALSFRYGQRQSVEIERAAELCARWHVGHRVERIDHPGGSALTDDILVPKGRTDREISAGVPSTYVPARNTVFLAHALAWAEKLGARHLFIGVNAVDYSGYPDCRPAFIEAFEALANVATAGGVYKIHAPLLHMTKAEIIAEGLRLDVDHRLTHTCYDPIGELSCGRCDACTLRLQAFRSVGRIDPIAYVTTPQTTCTAPL
jgi:7-cyano-7-deazaguanine synthase